MKNSNVKRECLASFKRNFGYVAGIMFVIMVAVIFFVANGCANNNHTVAIETPNPAVTFEATPEITENPTDVPTEEPTEVPTDTPEPTATPIPDDWYIDPYGVIPPEVEIIVPDSNTAENNKKWCITRVDGQATLQLWKRDEGLVMQWVVPEEMTNALSIYAEYSSRGLYSYAYETQYNMCDYMFYYEYKGLYLYVDVKWMCGVESGIIFITKDSKAIWYCWGENYYKMHDFEGADVYLDSDVIIIVNNTDYYNLDDLNWIEVTLDMV